MDKLLVIKHLKVQGTNAIAGLTWGFPAMTNFLGFTHALQRKVQSGGLALSFTSCAVVCHSSQVHASNNNLARETYFSLTRNPLVMKGKEAVTAPFNEEGKMAFDISLLIHVKGKIPPDDEGGLTDLIEQEIPRMRVAGGTVQGLPKAVLHTNIGEINRNDLKRKQFLRGFLPGFALVSRHDILQDHIQTTGKAPLEAWLDFSKLIKRSIPTSDDDDKADWVIEQLPYGGWLKPIAVGYQGISPIYDAGEVGHVRDRTVPAQFVESIYSLGQWISPHRITDINHLLWTQSYNPEKSLYLCENHYEPEESLTAEELTNTIEEH
ncbi:MAG: type I-F CRISPR-associated protein Csy2 [Pontibacterium sp.]